MNVGILTHHWPGNFGANLQALATCRALASLGHQAVVLNYRPPAMADVYRKLVSTEQTHEHESFCRRLLPQSDPCHDAEGLRAMVRTMGVDAVCSGSDAVLRLKAHATREDQRFPNPFWLEWADGIVSRKGFLAASAMGSFYPELPGKDRRGIRRVVSHLDVCSVRDQWTQGMLALCGVPPWRIRHCPDPVSVLPSLLEDESIPRPDVGDEPYLLFSRYPHMLSEEWERRFVTIAHRHGYRVFCLPQPDVPARGPFDRLLALPMDPLTWYAWIRHSKGYVGVRFHPIMIALSLDVPFLAMDDYDRGLAPKNPILAKLARKLRKTLRRMSKTYDLCLRAGKTGCVFHPGMLKRLQPEEAWQILAAQRPLDPSQHAKRSACFLGTLQTFLGSCTLAA